VSGPCPIIVPPYIWAKHLQVWRESSVEQSTRKESGWAVGVGGFESLAQTSTPARESSVDLLVDTQASRFRGRNQSRLRGE